MPDTENSIQNTWVPTITMRVSPGTTVYAPVDRTLSISDMPADAKATGDAIGNLQADILDLNEDITEIRGWTGEDIPLGEETSITIAGMIPAMWPVGAVYITTQDALPDLIAALGTWKEILLPLKWYDMKNGSRSHVLAEETEGVSPGSLHFWLRTE